MFVQYVGAIFRSVRAVLVMAALIVGVIADAVSTSGAATTIPTWIWGLAILAALFWAQYLAWATKERELRELRRASASVPESDRKLILQLRALAGRAMDLHAGISIPPKPPDTSPSSIEELARTYGDLRHYPEIYLVAERLWRLLQVLTLKQRSVSDHVEASEAAEKVYRELLLACESRLNPDPASPTNLKA